MGIEVRRNLIIVTIASYLVANNDFSYDGYFSIYNVPMRLSLNNLKFMCHKDNRANIIVIFKTNSLVLLFSSFFFLGPDEISDLFFTDKDIQ